MKPFSDPSLDAVFGDIHFIHDGEPDKVTRYYSSKIFSPFWVRFGFMPAHPSLYVRRKVYEKTGLYKLDYKIGADFEMVVRMFCVHKIKSEYLKTGLSLQCAMAEQARMVSVVTGYSCGKILVRVGRMVSIVISS